MAQIKRTPLADQAADLLLAKIRSKQWSLGAKLPGETTLATQLGVGRSTIREAIRQLAGKGVLETRQGAGVFVTALDITEEWDTVLQRAGIVAVIEARIAIEAEAATYAAERRTPQALRAIRKALKDRQKNHENTESYVDADMRFHRAIVEAADNPVLLELFDSFVPRLRQAMIEMLRLGRSLAENQDHNAHADLAEAIANRDGRTAYDLSRTHLTALKGALQ